MTDKEVKEEDKKEENPHPLEKSEENLRDRKKSDENKLRLRRKIRMKEERGTDSKNQSAKETVAREEEARQ